MKRIATLVAKELSELRRSPSIFLPAVLTGAAAYLPKPFDRKTLLGAIQGAITSHD